MTRELKTCPFCGSRNVQIIEDNPYNLFSRCYKVMCFKCKATSALAETKGMAIEFWNRRVKNEEEIMMNNIDIGETIAQRIGTLAREKGESVDFAAENISNQYNILCKEVNAVLHGMFWHPQNNRKGRPSIKDLSPETVINIIKVSAEYFSSTTDFILGLSEDLIQ